MEHRDVDMTRLSGGDRPRQRRSQEERKSETRDRLIKATIAEIQDRGYAGLKTRRVAERARMTWGAAQHLFGDKNDLLVDVNLYLYEKIIQRLMQFDVMNTKRRGWATDYVRHLWEVFSSPEMQVFYELVIGSRHDPEFYAKLKVRVNAMTRQLDQLWLKAWSHSSIPTDQLLGLRTVITLTLESLSIGTHIRGDSQYIDRALRALVAAIENMLQGANARSGKRSVVTFAAGVRSSR